MNSHKYTHSAYHASPKFISPIYEIYIGSRDPETQWEKFLLFFLMSGAVCAYCI